MWWPLNFNSPGAFWLKISTKISRDTKERNFFILSGVKVLPSNEIILWWAVTVKLINIQLWLHVFPMFSFWIHWISTLAHHLAVTHFSWKKVNTWCHDKITHEIFIQMAIGEFTWFLNRSQPRWMVRWWNEVYGQRSQKGTNGNHIYENLFLFNNQIFGLIYCPTFLCINAESSNWSQDLKSRFIQSLSSDWQRPISLLSDDNFRTKIQHFNRERTPGRRSFGTGNGAFGYFETTNKWISSISKAKIFEKIGKRCRVAVRFSSGPARVDIPQIVSNDAAGFSVRFYTEDGNWDLLTINTPVSSFRNPSRTFEGIHALEERAVGNRMYLDQKKDFDTLSPEGLHSVMWQYSDTGSHRNWRVISGFSVCGFRLVNSKGEYVNARFSIKSKKKFDYLSPQEADWFRGYIPDYYARDLYTAIERGNYPEYSLRVQIAEPKDEDDFDFFLFDPTKVSYLLFHGEIFISIWHSFRRGMRRSFLGLPLEESNLMEIRRIGSQISNHLLLIRWTWYLVLRHLPIEWHSHDCLSILILIDTGRRGPKSWI